MTGNPDYDGDGWDWRDDLEEEEPRDFWCLHCGAEIDHYLGCPDDPHPDFEAEARVRGLTT